ncbi:MAG TPA: PSD1 and planctomycete cytochrome C domain-containing protein [Planctomycetaceae bacterium]|nr:PSD1 and planctomycete cytochrome C domain-containing protein [Planctomycetaceae bacterium]
MPQRADRIIASMSVAMAALATLVCAPAVRGGPIDFVRDVQPILNSRCLGCHNGVKGAGGLRLLERGDVLGEAESGSRPVVPGKPEGSELLRRVASNDAADRMPADGEPLSPREIETIRQWIAEGAVWPVHWAFRAVERPRVPRAPGAAWARTPLDRFVLVRLAAANVQPAPEANRTTLLRRLHLDLAGLPPTPDEADEFIADASPGAYEKLIDRLLASPRFGERWGRHWLDLARYADTDGYEVDGPRPNAWHYRDWVIGAINEDLPFDRFTLEQLAGDLLPEATPREHLATAFHRQTLTNNEGGADQEEYRVEAVIDRVNTTATVWLGLTVGCTQCHDHPYEPLSQREFYGLFAFFNNADESQVRLPATGEEEYHVRKAEHERALEELRRELESASAEQRPRLEQRIRERERRAPRDPAVRLDVMAERVEPRTTYIFDRGNFLRPIRDAVVPPGGIGVLHALKPGNETRVDRLDLARWIVDPANPLTARVAVNQIWQHLFGRGLVRTPDNFGLNGDPPTHPELLDWLAAEWVGRAFSSSEARDRGWRIEDRGAKHKEQSPKHQPWSRKRLIRLIVTSAAYRQSAQHRPALAEIDPRNGLLHRQNRFRVEAEIVRDLHLAASGLLAEKIGGPSVFPPFSADLKRIDFRSDLEWNTSTGADRYRRGMYTFFKRTLPHPNLTMFDCPMADATAVERARSNTPLHALITLNNEVFVEAARAFAVRVLCGEKCDDDAARLTRAFQLAVTRLPSEGERARLLTFLDENRKWYAERPEEAAKLVADQPFADVAPAELAAWISTSSVILNLDEFITRE